MTNEIANEKTEKYICDICGDEFDDPTELGEHKKRHFRPEFGREDVQREIRGDIGAAGLPTSPTR